MNKLYAVIFTLLTLGSMSCYSQTKKTPPMKNVTEFKVAVSQQVLDDLKNRLQNTRWPGEAEGSGWNYGTSEAYLRGLVRYWQTEYDWRKQESLLNKYPQYIADVNGVKVHFNTSKAKAKIQSRLF